MADRKIDFGTLTLKDYAIGVAIALVAMALVSGIEAMANIALPGFVATAAGAVIGVAVWFIYLLKRKS